MYSDAVIYRSAAVRKFRPTYRKDNAHENISIKFDHPDLKCVHVTILYILVFSIQSFLYCLLYFLLHPIAFAMILTTSRTTIIPFTCLDECGLPDVHSSFVLVTLH